MHCLVLIESQESLARADYLTVRSLDLTSRGCERLTELGLPLDTLVCTVVPEFGRSRSLFGNLRAYEEAQVFVVRRRSVIALAAGRYSNQLDPKTLEQPLRGDMIVGCSRTDRAQHADGALGWVVA